MCSNRLNRLITDIEQERAARAPAVAEKPRCRTGGRPVVSGPSRTEDLLREANRCCVPPRVNVMPSVNWPNSILPKRAARSGRSGAGRHTTGEPSSRAAWPGILGKDQSSHQKTPASGSRKSGRHPATRRRNPNGNRPPQKPARPQTPGKIRTDFRSGKPVSQPRALSLATTNTTALSRCGC